MVLLGSIGVVSAGPIPVEKRGMSCFDFLSNPPVSFAMYMIAPGKY